jgi:hypothetical protein
MSHKKDPNYNPRPRTRFNLAEHQRLLLTRKAIFKLLLPDGLPGSREGYPVVCDPDGYPVVVLRPDLRPGEVNFVLR